ncbi:MAG: 4Fe-4S dicluster domain-containing protein [Candidatus Omnitrophota bacterium]
MRRLVKKEDLVKLIDSLLKEFEIIAPKELSGKGIFYQVLEDSKDLYLGQDFAIEPIKKFFLEPSSWILRHAKDDVSVESFLQSDKKRIVIGARPCEARGLTLLDKLFNSEYKDDFYINNRNRTIVIGLACAKPDESCFCTSMQGSPVETSGMDALILETIDSRVQSTEYRFILEIITDRGEDLFGSIGEEFKEDLKSHKEKLKTLVKKEIKTPDNMDKVFESDYWVEVSRSCISCGICTFLCPTCHCFDLVDEEQKRLRCYDGCSCPDFTLEASGVNPRPTKKERYRQRVYHKFDYFKKNFGENLCVGCGRCIRHCPVKIDIADIVDKIPC